MKKSSKNNLQAKLTTAIIITVALFVLVAIGVSICLAFELSDSNTPSYSSSGGSSGESSGGSSSSGSGNSVQAGVNVSNNTNVSYKTKPSRSNYLSQSNSSTAYISGDIKSKSAILVETGSNVSVAEKNADERIVPASMTKVMTLVVVCERITSLDTKLEVTQSAVNLMIETGGSGVGLEAGEKLTVKDYIYLMTYKSDTVASIVLADYIGGSQEGFVKLMNETAQKIGMKNTNFANCTGLYDENNYSTSRDIAALMLYALDNPYAKKMLTEYTAYRLDRAEGYPDITLYSSWYSERFNDNPRLSTVTVLGGKTGFEDVSGYTLVTYAKSKNSDTYYINVIVTRDKTLAEGGERMGEDAHVAEVKNIYNTYAK